MSSDTAEYRLTDIAVRMLQDPADSTSLDIANFVVSDNAYGVKTDTAKCM
jgi:hypothetical protein